MTKEYEQARDAAAKQILDLADRALWKGGATFATDYWAKEIEERDKMIAKLEGACRELNKTVDAMWNRTPDNREHHERAITEAQQECAIALADLAAFREGK